MVEVIAKSTYTEEKTRDFFKFHLYKVSQTKYLYFAIASILFIISVIFGVMGNLGISLFFLFTSIIVLVIRIAVNNITINKIIKNITYDAINYILKINEEEVIYSTTAITKKYPWSGLFKIFETKNYIYFYTNKSSALILHKYSITEIERVKLKQILEKKATGYKEINFK